MFFSFILQGTNIIINEQDDKENRNVILFYGLWPRCL